MGKIQEPDKVKYFCGITFQPECDIKTLREQLEALFSPLDTESDIFDFDSFTDYYKPEMGQGLKKVFWIFAVPEVPDALADKKIRSNLIEEGYLDNSGRRRINIDPGYFSLSNLVLATTKNFSHRVYLQKGIYSDMHLIYSQKSFNPMPWTYPDYKAFIPFFNQARDAYHKSGFGE